MTDAADKETRGPRRPDRPPSFLGGTKLVMMLAIRDLVARRKGIVMMLVLALPALIMIVAKIEDARNPGFTGTAPGAYLILIPLLCMFKGTSVFADEVDGRTIGYLLTRPISRDALYFGKFLAVWSVSSTMLIFSALAAWLPAGWRGSTAQLFNEDAVRELLAFLAVVVFSAALYTAIFMLISLVFRRAVLMGILYIFVVEFIFCMAIGPPAKITVAHHTQRLLPDSFQTIERVQVDDIRRRRLRDREGFGDILEDSGDPAFGAVSRPLTGVGLFAALAGLMGLGMVITRRSDFQHMEDD